MDDSGNPIGIEDIDETYTRLTNGVRDAISPDVTRFVHYVLQENKVIRIEVQEGTSKPYYLKRRGLKPSGVYIRQGASSVSASEDRIRQRIKDSDGDDFEGRTSRNQELTFVKRKSAFENIGIEFSDEKQIGLGLRNARRNLYTNLALILSDQCPYTIKVAVFEDDDNLDFHDSKEFTGSLFEQLRDCFDYLSLLNHTASVIGIMVIAGALLLIGMINRWSLSHLVDCFLSYLSRISRLESRNYGIQNLRRFSIVFVLWKPMEQVSGKSFPFMLDVLCSRRLK